MRRFIAAVLVVLAGCGGAPSAPSSGAAPASPTPPSAPVPRSFTGIWDLTFEVTECSASRPWYCPPGGQPQALTLRIDEEAGNALAVSPSVIVPLTAASREVGTLTLAGRREQARDESVQQIDDMRLRLDGGTLSGSFVLTTMSPTQGVRITGSIQSVVSHRDLDADADAAGHWRGMYVVRSCEILSGPVCRPDPVGIVETFDLTVTAAGGSLAGQLTLGETSLPVTGTVQGSQMLLVGETQQISGAITIASTVRDWTAARDRLGRLTGSFDYQWDRGVDGRHDRSVAHVELWYVARMP